MHSSRQDLLRLLASKSFRLGEFKLSSGGTSDYYIDCRTTTLDAKGARLTGEVFSDEIRKQGWKPQAIGGLTMGADPIVVAVSVVGGELNGFLVRKAEKQHGTGQRIEGFREKGARVVIVDDVCTTGAVSSICETCSVRTSRAVKIETKGAGAAAFSTPGLPFASSRSTRHITPTTWNPNSRDASIA